MQSYLIKTFSHKKKRNSTACLFLDIFLSLFVINSVEEIPVTVVVHFHRYSASQSAAKTTLIVQFNGDSNLHKCLINCEIFIY